VALVLDDGDSGDEGSHAATGVTEVIASGTFAGNRVAMYANVAGSPQAPIHRFESPGAVSVNAASGTVLTVKVVGKNTSAIDVTMNP
jgi:hypothetical protein